MDVRRRRQASSCSCRRRDRPADGQMGTELAEGRVMMCGANDTMEHVSVGWGLDRIDAVSGTDGHYAANSTHGEGVHVYVIDSGINCGHPEFEGRCTPAIDFTPE